jgi:hypothetical protein
MSDRKPTARLRQAASALDLFRPAKLLVSVGKTIGTADQAAYGAVEPWQIRSPSILFSRAWLSTVMRLTDPSVQKNLRMRSSFAPDQVFRSSRSNTDAAPRGLEPECCAQTWMRDEVGYGPETGIRMTRRSSAPTVLVM